MSGKGEETLNYTVFFNKRKIGFLGGVHLTSFKDSNDIKYIIRMISFVSGGGDSPLQEVPGGRGGGSARGQQPPHQPLHVLRPRRPARQAGRQQALHLGGRRRRRQRTPRPVPDRWGRVLRSEPRRPWAPEGGERGHVAFTAASSQAVRRNQ